MDICRPRRNAIKNFSFGLGPLDINITETGTRVGVNKVELAMAGLGAANFAAGAAYNALGGSVPNGVRLNMSNLCLEWSGGLAYEFLSLSLMGFGGGGVWYADAFSDVDADILREERTHLWQVRAMGAALFAGSYLYNYSVNTNLYHGAQNAGNASYYHFYEYIHWEQMAKAGGVF